MNLALASPVRPRRRFCVVLVKPSHYDEDGYCHPMAALANPVQLARLALWTCQGLRRPPVLGANVEIDIHALDETNTRIRPARLARLIERAGAGMVMLVGVQSNQFPRALDIAAPLRARGIPRRRRRLPRFRHDRYARWRRSDLDRARSMGISLFAGEAEGRLEQVLQDAAAGTLKPLYNFINELPNLDGTPIPLLGAERAQRTAGGTTSFDAGRGCPYQCSFCTIINVQGRKSRRRSPADIEKIVRVNYAQGLRAFFITDDNFARNKDWEPILDRIIQLRQAETSTSASSSRSTRSATTAELRREMRARRRAARVHRHGEHQSGQSDRRQEAPEQDHRIPPDAAGLEEDRRHHLCGLYPRLSQRHGPTPFFTTSRSSSANCRSIWWNSFI